MSASSNSTAFHEPADGAVETHNGAAFFDLDRTLLAGASGEVFADAMRLAGLSSKPFPGEKLLFGLFNTIGETLPSMALARQAVTLAKGHSQAAVSAAADQVADRLVAMVQPFADAAFEMHRTAGRPIVLATTTPYDLVKPFADRLGLDDVVATRYRVREDGNYDGTLEGPFVWSAGKLEAITAWAEEHGIDLAHSYAYSDSVYDTPMLDAVGNPVVVNPDPRMVLMAAARRWPTMNLDVSPGVVKIPVVGLEVQRLALQMARPAAYPYARFEISGVENIPADGPVILCANHRSYFDVSAMSIVIGKSGRTARFLGKKEVFDAPVVGQIATAMGGIRVDRNHSAWPRILHDEAHRALGRCPARPDVGCHGNPGRIVGHRESVAAVESRPEDAEPHRSAHRACQRRRAGCIEGQVGRCRHQTHHEGDHG